MCVTFLEFLKKSHSAFKEFLNASLANVPYWNDSLSRAWSLITAKSVIKSNTNNHLPSNHKLWSTGGLEWVLTWRPLRRKRLRNLWSCCSACFCAVLNDLWRMEIRPKKELFFNQGESGLASKGLLWHLQTGFDEICLFPAALKRPRLKGSSFLKRT